MGERTVTTEATGTATCDPERAQVELTVARGGPTPDSARTAAEDGIERVRDSLSGNHRSRRTNVRITETTDFDDADETVVAAVSLAVDTDPDAAIDVVTAGANAGAEIDGIEFGLEAETRNRLYERALEDGVERTRRRAETIVECERLALGKVISIETTERALGEEPRSTLLDATSATPSARNIRPNPIDVAVDVTATYRIV
ncbi:SIMPL domain-containing protein [Halobiforma nitratireducens]|uniref:Outer membrane protein n=1 Tax=Halobiforma nitratireducens JCM 10879 TaxID=1227454 RepID=M0M287_9EURY|nr:SIMPL domain-containing protein [Halobiforma nitratireducens]EMA39821.1 outer membrane protein [Halobiforma nitratireducens JCM 10879]